MKRSRSFQCKNNPDLFCFICGKYIINNAKKITLVRAAYKYYFQLELNEDKPWMPKKICPNCNLKLSKWYDGENVHLSFGPPMIWKEATDHSQCYFCVINLTGVNTKKRRSLTYPEVASVQKTIPHSDDLPKPNCSNAMATSSSSCQNSSESDMEAAYKKQHLINQSELNDLIRDLKLSKLDGELLSSRLQQWNFLEKSTKVTFNRKRSKQFSLFFKTMENKCYFEDVQGLFHAMRIVHNPNEWRLFIDGSKTSLKAALLHKGNTLPTIPVFHSVGSKETYECLKGMLNLIQYNLFKWKVCADLKVVAIITGVQSGYTKHCCFLCLWDSRARENHYVKQNWPSRNNYEPGALNVKNIPLVIPENVILPSLHIKLGLFKNFIKALDKDSAVFRYLQQIFPTISVAKIKEGILVGPQIRKLLCDDEFKRTMTSDQLNAWNSFDSVVNGFLGNNRAENYKALVTTLLKNYKKINVNMSLKIHFLHSHLDFFPVNLGAESDEHGERFHQDILSFENRFQGYWGTEMLGDYCWSIIRETNPNNYKKQANKTHVPWYK